MTRLAQYRSLARVPGVRRAYLTAKLRRQFDEFSRMPSAKTRFALRWGDRLARMDDATATTPFDRHYVYHVGWAARVLAETRPARHVDVGSSLYFASAVSAFVAMEFYDYRPPELAMEKISVGSADLLALPFPDGSVESVSCLHVIEHVGLGRYGEPLNPDGDLLAASELRRVVAPGGSLLVAMPVGRPRIAFNAHRIYGFDQVVEMFSPLTLSEFSLVPDTPQQGGLIRHASSELVAEQSYGCGCFSFTA